MSSRIAPPNPTSLSGHHQFLLRVNDQDARQRIRRGYVSIGVGIGIALGIKTQAHKLQSLAGCGPQGSGMLSYPVRKGQRIHAADLCCQRSDGGPDLVGLLSIEVFGYQTPACRDYAIALGKALQLTNILRDVRSDAQRGRVYLPLSELARFKVSPEEILRLEYSSRFAALATSVAGRARHFYQLARETLPAADRRSMVAAELMGSVYWRLLRKLERQRFNVFGPELTRLSKGQKLLLILRSWWRFVSGTVSPNYGA